MVNPTRSPSITRNGVRAVLPALCATLFLWAVQAGERPVPSKSAAPPDDPFPIRRILLSTEELGAALKKAREGALVRLPREEFEALVRNAAQAQFVSSVPRLIEAHYRAHLQNAPGPAALAGTAEWKIAYKGKEPALLDLEPLQIALRQARWSDGKPALLGLFDPRAPGRLTLLVEPGERSLVLEWSARSVLQPGGLTSNISVPPTAIATLELELPKEFIPVPAQAEALVVGSAEGDEQRRTWSLAFGGLSRLDMDLRSLPGSKRLKSLPRTHLVNRQEFTSGLVRCNFEFELEVLRETVTELAFEYDAALTVSDVDVNNLGGWKEEELPKPAGHKRLVVQFSEPTQGGRVEIRAVAPPPRAGEAWVCPGMAVVGGISRGETLELRVAPDLDLVDWRPGGFRLTRREISADQAQVLFLQSTLMAEGGAPLRPRAIVRARAGEFQVREQIEWAVHPDRSTLAAALQVEVTRGPLPQLRLRLPDPTWEVEQIEATPHDLTPLVTPYPGQPASLLLEFPRPLALGQPCSLDVRLRSSGPRFTSDIRQVLPFPDLTPVGARQREGTLTVRASPAFQASASAPPRESDIAAPGPARHDGSDLVWVYGFHGQPPAGALHLRPRPTRLTVRAESDIFLTDQGTRARTRLYVRPQAGVLPSLLLWSPLGVSAPSEWHTFEGSNPVTETQPVPLGEALSLFGLLGTRSTFDAAGRAGGASQGGGGMWWRLTFARPLDGPVGLESTYEPLPLDGTRRRRAQTTLATVASGGAIAWPPGPVSPSDISLPMVVGAEHSEGSVILHTPAGLVPGWEAAGFVADRPDPGAPGTQRFRYGDRSVVLHLVPRVAEPTETAASADGAQLTTSADGAGPLRCHYRFRLNGSANGNFPVRLPAGADVLDVIVAGRSALPGTVRVETTPTAVICSFAVPAGSTWREVEVVYTLPAEPWHFADRLTSPVPELPFPTANVARFWRLAPGLVPLGQGDLTLLPGGFPSTGSIGLPSGIARPLAGLVQTNENSHAPQPASARAQRAAPPDRETEQTFAQAISRLPAERPIIDRNALAEAGVDAGTPVVRAPSSTPFWEPLGLVAVPFRGGLVLTTPRQESIWRAEGTAEDLPFPLAVGTALREASARGADASGRFVAADEWLSAPVSVPSGSDVIFRPTAPGWTVWEAHTDEPELRVVRATSVSALGVVLGLALLAAALLRGKGTLRWDVITLAIWLVIAGTAAALLPPALRDLGRGPLLAGLLAALLYVIPRPHMVRDDATIVTRPRSGRRTGSSVQILPCVLLVAVVAFAAAAEPEPVTVYLLADTHDAEPSAVLAPPEALTRLQELARRRPWANVALLAAQYTGRARDGAAEFEARFDLHSFVDGPTGFVVPLAGVRLREAALDGAAALPQTAGPDRYGFEVPTAGAHHLVVHFSADVAGTGPDREVRFGIPELAFASLKFTAPSGADRVEAVNWRGEQHATASPDGPILESDLGRARTVHVRWRQAGKPEPPRVTVQELALWDIDGSAAALLAAFDYRVTDGSVLGLHVLVPEGLEVARVDVRPEPTPANAPATWVRDWRLGPDHVLAVDLQAPLSGAVRFTLELVPTKPLTTRPTLLFPQALDVAEAVSFVALRVQKLEVAPDLERQGVTEDLPTRFLRDIWKPAGLGAEAPTRAFRRAPKAAAILKPVLTAPGSAVRGSQDLAWWIGPRRLEVQGRARWSAGGDGVMLLEWEVPPPVAVTEVHGTGLQSWSRTGPRVQAWLQKPQAEVELHWSGVLARPAATQEEVPVLLPPVRLLGVTAQSATLRVRAAGGWTLTPEKLEGFQPLAPPGEPELSYRTDQPGTSLRFMLRGPQADATFTMLSFASVAERQFRFTSRIEANLRPDRPHNLTLVLRDAAAGEVALDAPGCRVTTQSPAAGTRSWSVEVPSRPIGRLDVTLSYSRPLPAATEMSFPELELLQGELRPARLEHIVALAGPELVPREAAGLRRVPDSAEGATLQHCPREADQLRRAGGAVWRVAGGDWRLALTAAPVRLQATAPVRVALADYESAPTADGWVYRACIELYHEAGAALAARLPTDARWVALRVDGADISITDSQAAQIAVPLPPDSGARTVYLMWERPDPVWEAPSLNANEAAVNIEGALWTVHLPAGWTADDPKPLRPAAAALVRAEALLSFSRQLQVYEANGRPDSPARVFATAAGRWLTLAANASGTSPDGQSLSDWHARLTAELTSLRPPGAQAAPASVESAVGIRSELNRLPLADQFLHGTPIRWRAADGSSGVSIRPPRDGGFLRGAALFLLIALAGSAWAALALSGRPTRPERTAALGLLGAIGFGWPEAILFLVVPVVVALYRFAQLGRSFSDRVKARAASRSRLEPPAQPPAEPNVGC
jgi:hypothetical protein